MYHDSDISPIAQLYILLFSRDESITLQQLESALTQLQGSSCEAKHKSLFSVLDEDHDGNINLDEMAEVCIINNTSL